MKALKSLAAGIACLSLVMALTSCPSPTDPAPSSSSDATLSSLILYRADIGSPTPISPDFDAATLAYSSLFEVPNSVSTITVFATATDSGATVVGAGERTLVVGDNSLSVVVTAADGTTKKTYTIDISLSSEASAFLSSLSATDLSLDFDQSNNIYSLAAPSTLASTTITAAADEAGATIEYKVGTSSYTPIDYIMFSGSATVNLEEGETTIVRLKVTSSDSSTYLIYAIEIARAEAEPPANAPLIITSPAAGATVDAVSGDLVVAGTYLDPNNEIAYIEGYYGLSGVVATFSNGSFSMSFPSSGLIAGKKELLIIAGNNQGVVASVMRTLTVVNGIPGRTVTMVVSLPDGLSSVDGYLTVALSEEIYLIHDLPLADVSFPCSLAIPGVPDRVEPYQYSIVITSGGFIEYLTEGESAIKYSVDADFTVNGADVDAGTVSLSSGSPD